MPFVVVIHDSPQQIINVGHRLGFEGPRYASRVAAEKAIDAEMRRVTADRLPLVGHVVEVGPKDVVKRCWHWVPGASRKANPKAPKIDIDALDDALRELDTVSLDDPKLREIRSDKAEKEALRASVGDLVWIHGHWGASPAFLVRKSTNSVTVLSRVFVNPREPAEQKVFKIDKDRRLRRRGDYSGGGMTLSVTKPVSSGRVNIKAATKRSPHHPYTPPRATKLVEAKAPPKPRTKGSTPRVIEAEGRGGQGRLFNPIKPGSQSEPLLDPVSVVELVLRALVYVSPAGDRYRKPIDELLYSDRRATRVLGARSSEFDIPGGTIQVICSPDMRSRVPRFDIEIQVNFTDGVEIAESVTLMESATRWDLFNGIGVCLGRINDSGRLPGRAALILDRGAHWIAELRAPDRSARRTQSKSIESLRESHATPKQTKLLDVETKSGQMRLFNPRSAREPIAPDGRAPVDRWKQPNEYAAIKHRLEASQPDDVWGALVVGVPVWLDATHAMRPNQEAMRLLIPARVTSVTKSGVSVTTAPFGTFTKGVTLAYGKTGMWQYKKVVNSKPQTQAFGPLYIDPDRSDSRQVRSTGPKPEFRFARDRAFNPLKPGDRFTARSTVPALSLKNGRPFGDTNLIAGERYIVEAVKGANAIVKQDTYPDMPWRASVSLSALTDNSVMRGRR